MARGILVPWPGIKPVPQAVQAQSPNHWTSRGVPKLGFLFLFLFACVRASPVAQQERICLQCGSQREHGFSPWVERIPWRRAWWPTPGFLPEESPCPEKPGGLQSMGSQRVGHNWSYLACTHACMHVFTYFKIFIYLAAPGLSYGMCHVASSFLIRDQTWAPCIGSRETTRENPTWVFFFFLMEGFFPLNVFLFIYLLIFWLCWVFVAAQTFSSCS